MTEETKFCPGCEQELPVNAFGKNRSREDGLQDYCRECSKSLAKTYREKNQGKITKYQLKYYEQNRDKVLVTCEKYRGTIVGHLRRVFSNMRRRCCNPNCVAYKNYGGRGIQNKFVSADDFVKYVVKILKIDPRGLEMDRIDNDGHYEKGNIRFVTCKVNNNNRRKRMVV